MFCLFLSGPGGAVRGGGKCQTAPPIGEGFLGDQSEESGDRPTDCSGTERPTHQGGYHVKSLNKTSLCLFMCVHAPVT